MEMGQPGRRGVVFDDVEPEVTDAVGDPAELVPERCAGTHRPSCRSSPSPRCCATTCTSRRRRSG